MICAARADLSENFLPDTVEPYSEQALRADGIKDYLLCGPEFSAAKRHSAPSPT